MTLRFRLCFILIGCLILVQDAFAQKGVESVHVKMKQATLHSKIENATYYLTKEAADTLPIRKMSVYYHTYNYDNDSFLCMTGYMYNVQLIGPAIEYRKSGTIEQSHNYVVVLNKNKSYGYGSMYNTKKGTNIISYDTLKHSFITWQLPSDTVVKESNYEFTLGMGFRGVENGQSMNNDGDKKDVNNYGFGYKEGFQKTYDFYGNLKWEICYHRNIREGPARYYFSCGWPNSRCGLLMEECHYKYDEREGEARDYYSTGKIQMIRNYRNGQLNGPALFFNGDSTLTQRCSYFYDSLDGKYESWYDNGVKHEESTYDRGIKIKCWKEWDESGKLISAKVYELPPPPEERQVEIQEGIDAVVEERGQTSMMITENLSEEQIQKLYSAWINTKEGKPLLKYDKPISFIIKIGYHGDITAQANEILPEKQMKSLFGFFKTLPAKEIVSQVNGINFVSEAVYEVKVDKK